MKLPIVDLRFTIAEKVSVFMQNLDKKLKGKIVPLENLEQEQKFLRTYMKEMNNYLSRIIDSKSLKIQKQSQLEYRQKLERQKYLDSVEHKIQYMHALKRNNGTSQPSNTRADTKHTSNGDKNAERKVQQARRKDEEQ